MNFQLTQQVQDLYFELCRTDLDAIADSRRALNQLAARVRKLWRDINLRSSSRLAVLEYLEDFKAAVGLLFAEKKAAEVVKENTPDDKFEVIEFIQEAIQVGAEGEEEEEIDFAEVFANCPPPPIPQGHTRDDQGLDYYSLAKLYNGIQAQGELKEAVGNRLMRLLYDDVTFNDRDYQNLRKDHSPWFLASRCASLYRLDHWLDCGLEALEMYAQGKCTDQEAFQFLENASFIVDKFLNESMGDVYSPKFLLVILKIDENLKVATNWKRKGLTEAQIERMGHPLKKICTNNIRLFCGLILGLLGEVQPYKDTYRQYQRYQAIKLPAV